MTLLVAKQSCCKLLSQVATVLVDVLDDIVAAFTEDMDNTSTVFGVM